MTELDKYQPEGEPIHPFDMFELIESALEQNPTVLVVRHNPAPSGITDAEIDQDYARNIHKCGATQCFGGKAYFVTTTVAAKTTRFQ